MALESLGESDESCVGKNGKGGKLRGEKANRCTGVLPNDLVRVPMD